MWGAHGVEFFIHPAMQATEGEDFPGFFRHDRAGAVSRRDPSNEIG